MLRRIIIRDAVNSAWLSFSDPVDVLVARKPEDVLDQVREAERRAGRQNLYAAGFLAYEAASGIDPAYVTRPGNRLPLVCFGLFADIERMNSIGQSDGEDAGASAWRMTGLRRTYLDNIRAIKRQIELGNTYQVNYTVREQAANVTDPWALFLRTSADAPYAAYVECDDWVIVSASPELFFELEGERVVCKPMKGTSPRGLTSADDRVLRRRLDRSVKNRAENVMITDMVRNDLGRIAVPGSVRVPILFDIEKYPTVWQMTSTVSAKSTATVSEIFQALFPCASVTGAPKVSSMAIIAALEDTPREVYTGAIGFMGPNREARFNVAIRTAFVDSKTSEAVYGVGGGIVWDSDPEEEYGECLTKARILAAPGAGRDFELLETLLWRPQQGYFLLKEHLNRMRASAQYFDFAFDQAMVESALEDLTRRLPAVRHRVRLLLRRDGHVRVTETAIPGDAGGSTQRIALAREPIDVTDPFVYHKTTRRDAFERALRMAGEVDDVLLWNEDGYITETTIANVLVPIEGDLYTPPVTCGLLAGTYREILLRTAKIRERKIHVSEVSPATELILINSVRREYPARLSLAAAANE